MCDMLFFSPIFDVKMLLFARMTNGLARLALLLLLAAWLLVLGSHLHAVADVTVENMNPHEYRIANAPGYPTHRQGSRSAYFEVYSPVMRTLYAQVYWTMQDPVELPRDIVEQFSDGRVMAVVGYEVDQVRLNKDGTEVSVPITWSYNHHYLAWLMQRSPQLDQELRLYHKDHKHAWGTEQPYPKSTLFSEGNGGEFRSSFHSYPTGYAQLVQSPTHFQFNPMSIDTWNRTAQDDAIFHPGPLPASSRIPPSAGYSGLIECPCADKFVKQWQMTYKLDRNDKENDITEEGRIQNITECLGAVKSLVPSNSYKIITDPATEATAMSSDQDKSCALEQFSDGSVNVYWRSKPTNTVSNVHVDDRTVAFSDTLVNVTVVRSAHNVQITMAGPADAWFGLGLGSHSMCIHQVSDECPERGPYAIIVSGDSVTERKLDQHGAGHQLASSVSIESNAVQGNNRTVVLSRPLQGLTEEHFTFDQDAQEIPMIAARGCSLEFARHCGHGFSTLQFLTVNQVTSVCRAGIQGTIGGTSFSNIHRCADQPVGDLKAQHNPTCRIETYQGGMACCHHGETLLDANQPTPWPDQFLEMRFKFRFYYQEYQPAVANQPASHQQLYRLYWQTETYATEYDVPQCAPGTAADQCIHTITSRFTARGLFTLLGYPVPNGATGVELIYAGPHCHAPSCLSMELYNADTGELLCHGEPVFGESGDLYDEKGFLALPPCLWGSPDEGLIPPRYLSLDTNLMSIKRNNSTLPHTGEMASWQMRGVVIYEDDERATTMSVSRTSMRGFRAIP